MLEIISNGTPLDLSADISISLTIENPFMSEDRIPTPYTLSFDLPATPNNLSLFGYPNRIGSYGVSDQRRSMNCVIRFRGLSVVSGFLILQSYNKVLKVYFTGVDFNDILKNKLFEVPLDTLDITGSTIVTDYNASGNYGYNYRQWAKAAANGSDNRFVIAPIGRNNDKIPFSWWEPNRRSNEKNLQISVNRQLRDHYYNAFNPKTQEFYFENTEGNTERRHVPIFPQFRLCYLFESLIPNLVSNPFDAPLFYNIVIPSYYHPLARYAYDFNRPLVSNLIFTGNNNTTGPAYILLKDFLPNLDANIFVKEILKIFCSTLYKLGASYKIKANSDILSENVQLDWSNKVMNQLEFIQMDKRYYEYGYSDSKQIYDNIRTATTVATMNDMINYTYTFREDEYEQVFFITATNQYFQKNIYIEKFKEGNGTFDELIFDYSFLGYKVDPNLIAPADQGQNKYSSVSNISFSDVYPTVFFESLKNQKTTKLWNSVPRHSPVNDSSSSNTGDREESFELLMFEGSKPTANTYNYPYLSPYGNANLSFGWEGANGLLNKFHLPFKAWIEKEKLKVSTTILLDILDFHQLDVTNKVHLNGRNFFIEKIQFTIKHNSIEPSLVDLIET